MRQNIHDYYLEIVERVATRSTCPRRKAGAIITDGKQVLSTGYNGVPRGYPHCTDIPCDGYHDPSGDTSRCHAIHAEINAIIQCSQLHRATVMYTSARPCFKCALVICNTPIRTIFYNESYPDERALKVFEQCGVKAVKAVNA